MARPRRWIKRAIVAGATLLVVAAGAWAALSLRSPGLDPKRVVVVPFENATGDSTLDPIGRQAADWIAQGLVQAGVPNVATSGTSLGSPAGQEAGGGSVGLVTLAREARAGTVVTGSYSRHGDSLRFQAQVTDANSGQVVTALDPVQAPRTAPLDAVGTLRERVMAALAGRVNPQLQAWGAIIGKPPRYESYLAWSAGVEAWGRDDYLAARDLFRRAVALDSSFTLALLWEGLSAWSYADPPRFDSIVARLEGMRDRLSPYERARLDRLKALNAQDWERAYEAGRRAVEASGGADEDAREMALDALRSHRTREAVRILEGLDPTRGWLAGWTAYWNTLGRGYHILGDYRAELRTYRRSQQRGATGFFTRVTGLRALAALGRYEELNRELAAADASTQDPLLISFYHSWAGPELMAHGNRDSGQAVIRRGIALLRTWSAGGADSMEVNRRAGLALLLYYAGDWDGCGAAWGNLERPTFLVEAPCPPWILAARHGDRAQADRLLAAYDSSVRSAPPTVRIWAVVAHARVAAILGDRERAVDYLRQAVPTLGFDDMSIVPHSDIDFESLWNYPPFIELLRPKG